MRKFSRAQLFILLCFFSSGFFLGSLFALARGEARTFDFKTEYIAPYVGGTYGLSAVGDMAYGGSSGNGGVTTDQKVSANASGEVGFMIPTSKFNIKFGVEFLAPRTLSGINGSSSSGTALFTLDSTVYAVIPMINFEYLAHQTPDSHFLIGLGGGMAYVTLENNYTMTTAGTTATGVGNTDEKGTGQAPVVQGYLGYETLITDNATLAFDIGYRYAPVSTINSTQNISAPAGTEVSGQPLVNMDGSNRSLNLSGPFVGLSFRFYIGG